MKEGHRYDRKSLRTVSGKRADFVQLARDCVCFANGAGGQIAIGIEDEDDDPPAGQRIDATLLDRIRKRIGELTVNVQALPEVRRSENGGEFIMLLIPRSLGVASTTDGRYFLRVGDDCQPVTGDDVLRLANERPAIPWERMSPPGAHQATADRTKLAGLAQRIRGSDRVALSVKEKSDHELLQHYGLAVDCGLTNLGVLLVGTASDRARLGTAPVVQAIRYDERGVKVGK